MQVHGDHVIAAGRLQHVGHQLGRDWRARFVLFVLPSVGKVGNNGRNPSCGGRLASVDDDKEFHESIVDIAGGGGLEDEHFRRMDPVSARGTLEPKTRKSPSLPSSSRTDSPIVTEVSWLEYCRTMILVSSMPSLENFFRCFQRCEQGRTHGLPISHQLRQFGVAVACQQLDRIGGHDRHLESNCQGLMAVGPWWTKG